MGWFNNIISSGSSADHAEIKNVFPFPISERDFVNIDLINIYSRILTDVLERTQGFTSDEQILFWDNCLASEHSEGLVTMLSTAMAGKHDLFIVYDKALKLIRKATTNEESLIKADYKKMGMSNVGVLVSFKQYRRTDMLKIYSTLEYCAIASLNKSMNLSKALQFKAKNLRSSVNLSDSGEAAAQAKAVAQALGNGNDVLVDAEDSLESMKPDLEAANSSMAFINQKRSFYLGLPAAYITGLSSKSMSDSGDGEAKAVERGLVGYYFSIIKPVCEAMFKKTTEFKSENYEQISTSLEVLKTFEITSDELLSKDNKQLIVNRQFGLPDDAKGDSVATPAPAPQVNPKVQ